MTHKSIKKIVIFLAAVVAVCSWGKVQAGNTYDRTFLLNRAVELAQFAPDEKIVLPQIKYYLPGDNKIGGLGFSPLVQRVVTIFDPGYGLGGVQAIFIAPTYSVIDGDKKLSPQSFKKTVGDILRENSFEIANEDVIEPALSSEAEVKKEIKITRVAIAEIQEFETLPYRTRNIDDDTLDKGKTRVSQSGKTGKKTLTYQVRRENGVEVSRILLRQEVVAQPTEEIVKVGIRPAITVRCKYNDIVLAASIKYKQDSNALCNLMMKESRGNPNSDGGQYQGLFQYDVDFWPDASQKAGFAGSSIYDPNAQIYTTAYLFSIGQGGRW